MYDGEACLRTKAERTVVRIARWVAWSGSPTAAPSAIPFGRLYVVSDSLRRHAYTVIVEAVMSTRKKRKTGGLVGRSRRSSNQFAAFTADLIAWLTG